MNMKSSNKVKQVPIKPIDVIKSNESEQQQKFIAWVNLYKNLPEYKCLKLLYHPANEGKRSHYTGKKLKDEGLLAGVVDICLPASRGRFHGLYIEMKYGKNKLTQEQRAFLKGVKEEGYATGLCYSADEAIALVKKYLLLPKRSF